VVAYRSGQLVPGTARVETRFEAGGEADKMVVAREFSSFSHHPRPLLREEAELPGRADRGEGLVLTRELEKEPGNGKQMLNRWNEPTDLV